MVHAAGGCLPLVEVGALSFGKFFYLRKAFCVADYHAVLLCCSRRSP